MNVQKNKHYLNLNQCAVNLSDNYETDITDNTLPITMEAISNIDRLPPPNEVNGVDLKLLYETLANLMAGYPTNEIPEGPTKEFLKQCFSVSSPDFDEIVVIHHRC